MIDCHVHVAPDKLAEGTERHIQSRFGLLAGRMTADAVRQTMRETGISTSVVFNTAPSPKLVRPANDFVIEINDNATLIGLGTIHPAVEEAELEVDRLRASGVRGIKFHALVQHFGAGDDRLAPVYRKMGSDMVAYFHCGKNPADLAEPVLTTPESVASIKKAFPSLKIVAAHWGGFDMPDEARKHIFGQDIYIDTSWFPGTEVLDTAEMARVIRDHGSHRIVFGSDYPTTSGVQRQIDWVRALPIREEDKERILWKNAKELFAL